MSNQPQPQINNSPLLHEKFAPIGIAIYISLQREFARDPYSRRIYEFAYITYLDKHPEIVAEYNESLDGDDYKIGSNILISIAKIISNSIHCCTVRIEGDVPETREKIKEITKNPSHQKREKAVEILRNSFICNESDLQVLYDYLQSLNIYSGSMIGVGKDRNDAKQTALIIHIFSIE